MEVAERKSYYTKLEGALKPLGDSHEISWILDHLKSLNLSEEQERSSWIDLVIERKRKHEPLPYILGSWNFRGHELFVGPGALIPRPETEEMVEAVIMAVENSGTSSKKLLSEGFSIADLGAGSACIGLSLVADLLKDIHDEGENAQEISTKFDLHLVEKSPEAVSWAVKNIKAMGPKLLNTKVTLHECDWGQAPLPEQLDLVISNPPYVSQEEFKQLDPSVKNFEPSMALVPPSEDPNHCYKEILRIASQRLRPEGWVFCELGPSQQESVQEIASGMELFNDIRTLRDMAKKPRIFAARKRSPKNG